MTGMLIAVKVGSSDDDNDKDDFDANADEVDDANCLHVMLSSDLIRLQWAASALKNLCWALGQL